jgi:Txe/YoeB family toxin of Txe-Axe toxin-antitoxin module
MNEQSSDDSSDVRDQGDTDVFSLLKRMQQQLLSLEKKIDILINQAHENPFREKRSPERSFRERSFSRPSRSFGHSHRYGKGEHEQSSKEKSSAQRRFSEQSGRNEERGFGPKRKLITYKRKDRA